MRIKADYNLFIRISLLILILANFLYLKNVYLGLFLFVVYAGIYGLNLGRLLFAKFDKYFHLIFGSLTLFFVSSSIYWLFFYLYKVPDWLFVLVLILVSLIIEWLMKEKAFYLPKIKVFPLLKKIGGWGVLFVVNVVYLFNILWQSQTVEAIASPWHVVPNYFWLGFVLLTIFLMLNIFRNKYIKFNLFLVSVYFFLISSVAFFVFKLGYGYDPFLHFAAIKSILIEGLLLPKPFYYVGEYGLLIYFHDFTQVSIEFINRIFLPLIFSLFFPVSVYYGLVKGLQIKKKVALALTLVVLFLPVSFFISTTPQGLTNLLVLIVVFLSLIPKQNLSRWYLVFLSVITCTVHPFFGLPILLYSVWLLFKSLKMKKMILYLIAVGSVVVVPLMFIFNSYVSGQKVFFGLNNLQFNWPGFIKQFNFIKDLMHVYGSFYHVIYLILIVVFVWLISRSQYWQKVKEYLLFAMIFLINFILVNYLMIFDFTTAGNMQDFSGRVFELFLYFLLPIFLIGGYLVYEKNWQDNNSVISRIFIIMILLFIPVLSMYFSYPLDDDYRNTKFYSLSESDIKTVRFINNQNDSDYIVLANQQVAAAAIREFGFAKYYNNGFYYSIPDGQEDGLYQYFEKMVYEKPDLEYIKQAMETAGVDNAYLVLCPYWTNFKNLAEQIKTTTELWWLVEGNLVAYYYR